VELCVTYCGGEKDDGILPPDELYKSRRIDTIRRVLQGEQSDVGYPFS